ncbi:porin Gram-negative type [Dickeya chrysanthemi Ech1591]|uniref:Porin Gram-negative type n=1 Tax=Dickeya chrysanthemi (strain Ech1591) TaxID=561229 RepID=C6CFJ1_DICC1|nr:porin [Dickeya chrysanthemi]ACT06519.1 porin Gram-negative type [Dickeya chrysanthemi Ech1591]
MMKRNVLAVVIPALLAAGAANAAEVYNKDGNKLDLNGKVVGLHYFSKDDENKGDQSYVRMGFKGETQITKDLTGYGRFEYNFNANQAEDTNGGAGAGKTRYAYAGLKFGDFGSLDYGRNRGLAYDGISYTDVLPEFGGDSSYTDNLTGRNSGVLTYRNKNFFGLVDGWDFGLQYQSKHEDSTNTARQSGAGWGVSSSYTSPIGVAAIASYAEANRTEQQKLDGNGLKAETWATGLKYDANNVYVAATYAEYHNLSYIPKGHSVQTGSTFTIDSTGSITPSAVTQRSAFDKTKIFEAVAQYNFDFGLTPSLGYVQAKASDDTAALKTDDYLYKYVSLGATYSFNKNMSVYTEYDINLIDSDNAYSLNTNDRVAVGVVYQF